MQAFYRMETISDFALFDTPQLEFLGMGNFAGVVFGKNLALNLHNDAFLLQCLLKYKRNESFS